MIHEVFMLTKRTHLESLERSPQWRLLSRALRETECRTVVINPILARMAKTRDKKQLKDLSLLHARANKFCFNI